MKKFIKEWMPYAIIIVLVILIKKYIITPIKVNGPSMNNTLYDKDIMLLDEISYRFLSIKRFDIVVVKYGNELIIKRVIGLPGEKISCSDNKLYINGEILRENYSIGITSDFSEITISENEYFVLGDNRENSIDSRIIGSIPIKQIKGKAILTIYPFQRFGTKN